MSTNLDQSFDSLQVEIGYDVYSNEAAFKQATSESFKRFPDEILPLIFHQLTAFERCLILSVCRNWNGILLGGRGFWQIVHLPHRLPISAAISILQTFNLRSGFSLKEVVFEPIIRDVQDLDRIFEELRKSSSTIKVLVLPQLSKLNTQTRRFSRSILPSLQFLYSYDHRSDPRFISRMWADLLKWRSERRGEDPSNQEETEIPSLNYYSVNSLNRVGREERTWFKRLNFLEVHSTHSLEDLHLILDASKSRLQELNLSWWGKQLKDLENVDSDLITMKNSSGIFKFYLPFNASAARALSKFLEFPGQVQVSGNLASLLGFEMRCLVVVKIRLYDEGEDEKTRGPSMAPDELKEKTDLFLKLNPSVSTLVLRAPSLGSGSSFHLNYVLERLIAPSNSSSTNRHGSPNATQGQDPLLLPKLKILEIHEPTELDRTLLRRCLESRRGFYPLFQLRVMVRGKLVRESKWEGQKWMK
jgi:hypothetical protein